MLNFYGKKENGIMRFMLNIIRKLTIKNQRFGQNKIIIKTKDLGKYNKIMENFNFDLVSFFSKFQNIIFLSLNFKFNFHLVHEFLYFTLLPPVFITQNS